MLRIAVPNKGSLSGPATDMLREAGYRQRRDTRELVLADPDNGTEFFFLRPRDVAVYVGSGTVDVGITGRDLLLDSGADAVEHLPLGFATSTFRFAAPAGTITDVAQIEGKRVASSYTTLVASHLAGRGVEPAAIVHLDGAVESSVRLGVADVIADVVETGTTLRAAGLEVGDIAKVGDAVGDEATVVDLVRRGRCDLVVNTPQGSGARADGYLIREAALTARVPCVTTISGAAAAVHAIANARAESALSLQERIGIEA